MPNVDVVNTNNKKVRKLDLSDEVFAAPVNEALLYESVRHYMAEWRSGCAKTKSRREVSGAGRKLWKQKGTGRARIGSIRSSLWRHGYTVHGPKPRDYSYRLPRKMLLGALRSALTAKLNDGELKVVASFKVTEPKTKSVRSILDNLDARKTVLLVDNSDNENLTLGSRNLEGVTLMSSKDITTYDLLGHEQVLVSEEAAKKLSEALSK